MTIERIISGGQTGADRGGLYGAKDAIDAGCPIQIGGWAPSCFIAEDGTIPDDLARYMRECDVSGYPVRTKRNIFDSDATLVIYLKRYGSGTALTIKEVMKAKKPLVLVRLPYAVYEAAVAGVLKGADSTGAWVSLDGGSLQAVDGVPAAVLEDVRTLNIAGPRESHDPGLQAKSREFVKALLLDLYPCVHVLQ